MGCCSQVTTGWPHSYVVATPEPLTRSMLEAALAEGMNALVRANLGPPLVIADYLEMSAADLERVYGAGRVVTDNNAYFMPMRGTR